MICPYCFHKKTTITNSRGAKSSAIVWRRHRCNNCHTDFSTYETVHPTLLITNGEGKEEQFSLGKLHLSIANCFIHNQERSGTDSLEVAKTIQTKLLSKGSSISNYQLSQIAYSVLQNFDPLAAIQYGMKHGLVQSTKRRPGRPSTKYDVL